MSALTPAAEASFVPDTLVGSIQIGIGDRAETYYFHANEKVREEELDSGALALLNRFEEIERACLGEDDGTDQGGSR